MLTKIERFSAKIQVSERNETTGIRLTRNLISVISKSRDSFTFSADLSFLRMHARITITEPTLPGLRENPP